MKQLPEKKMLLEWQKNHNKQTNKQKTLKIDPQIISDEENPQV